MKNSLIRYLALFTILLLSIQAQAQEDNWIKLFDGREP